VTKTQYAGPISCLEHRADLTCTTNNHYWPCTGLGHRGNVFVTVATVDMATDATATVASVAYRLDFPTFTYPSPI